MPSATESGAVLAWGELLWDLYPDGARLGGCAANVAYHVRRLGSRAHLVSRVGGDDLGRRGVAFLEEAGVDVTNVQVDPEAPTGAVRVDLSSGEPRFSIAQQAAWDRIEWTEGVASAVASARVLYFGTLAQRTPLGATVLACALDTVRPDCVRICDLNLRPPFVTSEVIEQSAAQADVVKLNESEARYVETAFGCRDAIEWLLSRAGVRLVALTRGERGSVLATRAARVEQAPVHYPAEDGDAVGAGDAFTAVLAHHLPAIDDPAVLGALASRYAGFVASRPGAMPDVPEWVVRAANGR